MMTKTLNGRKILSISEIDYEKDGEKMICKNIFQYNPESTKWDLQSNLYDTNVIRDAKKYEDIKEVKFEKIISIYVEIFEFLFQTKRISNFELVDLFHQLAYFSNKPLGALVSFWEDWKNLRV